MEEFDIDTVIDEEARKALCEISMRSSGKKSLLQMRIYLVILAAVCAVFMLLMPEIPVFIIAGVLLLVILLLLVQSGKLIGNMYKRNMDTRGKEDPTYSGSRQYHFDENSVTITSDAGENKVALDGFRVWGECGEYIYLRHSQGAVLLIDTRRAGEKERELLTALPERLKLIKEG
ncbi:MAG: hypothetical protein J6X60_06915 [Ruminiclostridium sp.]|nr:hypothetical protein [Ruminiclostridium sp.]